MASSPVKDLLERRVPQYVAVYLGASWALVEFFAFLEDRFLLSPYLTNLVLALLVLILPSVVLFTYNHGRPGADRWRPVEKVFIPSNIALTAIVLLAAFSGKDLGAVTTMVTTRDEEGNPIERAVAKSEFRKRLALFPVDAPSDASWLGEVVMLALDLDLYQDMFIDLRISPQYMELLRERGHSDASAVPRPLKREVARELNLQHFVDGSVQRTPSGYRLRLALHDVEGGDVVAASRFQGPDLLPLVDSGSVALRQALELPASHLAENGDVPVSELTTESSEAFRYYATGIAEMIYDLDYDAAVSQAERAVQLDSTFALAQALLYEARLLNGDEEGAGAALRGAIDHLYRLPERLQFAVKAEYYAYQQDMQKAFAVLEMRAELYPQDIQAQLNVAEVREVRDDLPGAIAALETALELDPTQAELLQRIGGLHQRLGQYPKAEDYYRRSAERLPDRADPYRSLGGLQLATGEHDRARESYERALLVDPDDVEVLVALAELDRAIGDWQAAQHHAASALEAARTQQGRLVAFREMRRYHEYRRDQTGVLAHQERMTEAARESLPPVSVAMMEILGLGDYVRAGRAEEARARLDRLSGTLPAVVDAFAGPLGRLEVWLALEEPDSIGASADAAKRAIERSGLETLAPRVLHARARMHELREEWPAALEDYRREQELTPSDVTLGADLARIHRQLGDLERAEALLLETLAVWPSHGAANLQLGKVYLAAGRPEDAIRHLERALDTWAIGDPADAQVADARATLDDARLRLRAVRSRG